MPRRFEDGLDGAGEGVQRFLLPLHDVEGAAVDGSGDDSLSRERPDGTEQEREQLMNMLARVNDLANKYEPELQLENK